LIGSNAELGANGARDTGRALGGLAVLRARLGLGEEPPSQHVHADRNGNRASPGPTAWRQRSCRHLSQWRFRANDGSVPVYFEAAAVITVLVLLGQLLELRARETTSGAIRALLDLSPKLARRVRADGSDEEVTLDEVLVGDTCASVPARRCRLTVWFSMAAARSMNRW
jgi:hypothetical protein